MDRNQGMWQAISAFVGTASIAATILGQPQIAGLLALGNNLMLRGVEARRELDELTAKMQQFIDEKRNPTDEEWAALTAAIDYNSSRIQSLGKGPAPATAAADPFEANPPIAEPAPEPVADAGEATTTTEA